MNRKIKMFIVYLCVMTPLMLLVRYGMNDSHITTRQAIITTIMAFVWSIIMVLYFSRAESLEKKKAAQK